MKKIIFFLFSFVSWSYCCSQSNVLAFDYDVAGNQVKRQLICVNCRETNQAGQDSRIFENSDEYQDISFYPNPVIEHLSIKWSRENSFVEKIEIYSLSGQYLQQIGNLKDQHEITLDFNSFSQGMFNVLLLYNDGSTKNLKIIKK